MKKTQSRKIVSIMITSTLMLMMLAALGFYFVRSQETARAKLPVQDDVLRSEDIQEIEGTSEEVVEGSEKKDDEAIFEVLSQTIDDVTVEVTYVKKIETGVEIGVCFTTLDNGEWYPGPGYLTSAEEKFPPDEFEFLDEIHANKNSTGTRCAAIRYRVDDEQTIIFPLQFEMRDVHMIPREMPACQNLQYRLDTNPKAQEYGIAVDCTEGKMQGEMDVSLSGFSKSVTEEEAQIILDEIIVGRVNGPWNFMIEKIE